MPRRWSDLDSDEYRLPEGFRRVGYDADERRYYFHDGNGQTWRSEPGNEYGLLTRARPEPPVTIPRRPPPPPPPPHSKKPVDDSPPRESTPTFKAFREILKPHQLTSASSTPKRSHTINIPSVAALKRSSSSAASFVRSRGKYFTKSRGSKEASHDDVNEPSHTIPFRRIVSSPVETLNRIRRRNTTRMTE
ncbi:hypothetical protein BJ322DRAFT_197307 [Thelephora terrestris]|uniref:WW domain-containing protein n=1 Tax=Thelephora terrestris TaxID=56493 RepID=A0A9P6HBY2_9AGAM|nr:hypothetical protein BJ322DRAFT_197307 [Thelephora terrestris]